MNEADLNHLWFQSKIYKKQNFGKIIYFSVNSNANTDKDKVVDTITKINVENWDGLKLNSTKDFDFIEAIDKDGEIIFIYSCLNKVLFANSERYYNVNVDKITLCLNDSQHNFYIGDKKKEYDFNVAKVKFIDSLYKYEGLLWYIVSVENESRMFSHGHNDFVEYYICKRYKLYNGQTLLDVTIDSYSHDTVQSRIDCRMPDIDKLFDFYRIRL